MPKNADIRVIAYEESGVVTVVQREDFTMLLKLKDLTPDQRRIVKCPNCGKRIQKIALKNKCSSHQWQNRKGYHVERVTVETWR